MISAAISPAMIFTGSSLVSSAICCTASISASLFIRRTPVQAPRPTRSLPSRTARLGIGQIGFAHSLNTPMRHVASAAALLTYVLRVIRLAIMRIGSGSRVVVQFVPPDPPSAIATLTNINPSISRLSNLHHHNVKILLSQDPSQTPTSSAATTKIQHTRRSTGCHFIGPLAPSVVAHAQQGERPNVQPLGAPISYV